MKHILGVSMPRSGHHYLVRLLRSYFGDEMGYCEFYGPKDCCKKIPCNKTILNKKLFYQKNHDHQLNLRVGSETSCILVIQFRHPVYQVSSNFELEIKNREYLNNVMHLQYYLAISAHYYINFWRKWLEGEVLQPAITIEYNDLVSKSMEELSKLLIFLGFEIDKYRIMTVIQENQKLDNDGQPFRKRTIDSIKKEYRSYIAVMEDIIFKSGIKMPMYKQLLERYVNSESAIYDIFQSLVYEQKGDIDISIAYLEQAYGKGINSPRMLVRLARLYRKKNNLKRCDEILRLAYDLCPEDPIVNQVIENNSQKRKQYHG